MHKSFKEYIDYKQKKYEKSLKRKCKGIYKKRNTKVKDPKMEFHMHSQKLQFMQNISKIEEEGLDFEEMFEQSEMNSSDLKCTENELYNEGEPDLTSAKLQLQGPMHSLGSLMEPRERHQNVGSFNEGDHRPTNPDSSERSLYENSCSHSDNNSLGVSNPKNLTVQQLN